MRVVTEDPCGNSFVFPNSSTIGVVEFWTGYGCSPDSTAEKLATLGYTGFLYGANFWKHGSIAYSARSTYFYWNTPIPIYRVEKKSLLMQVLYENQQTTFKADIRADHNPSGDLSVLKILEGFRSVIIFAASMYKLRMCFFIVKAQIHKTVGNIVTYTLVTIETLGSMCVLVLLGDLGFSFCLLDYGTTLFLVNASFILSNLSTLTIAQVLLHTLNQIKAVSVAQRAIIWVLTIIVPLIHLYVTLGGIQLIKSISQVYILNVIFVALLNGLACVFFMTYKQKIARIISTPSVSILPIAIRNSSHEKTGSLKKAGSVSKTTSLGQRKSASAKGNSRRVLKMAALLRVSGLLALVVVVLGPVYTFGLLSGNHHIFSWGFALSAGVLQLMGIVQLLSLSISEDAGYKKLINQLLDVFDKEQMSGVDKLVTNSM